MSKKARLKVYADLVEPLLADDGNALLNLASEYPFRHETLQSAQRKSVEEMPVRLAGSVSAR